MARVCTWNDRECSNCGRRDRKSINKIQDEVLMIRRIERWRIFDKLMIRCYMILFSSLSRKNLDHRYQRNNTGFVLLVVSETRT